MLNHHSGEMMNNFLIVKKVFMTILCLLALSFYSLPSKGQGEDGISANIAEKFTAYCRNVPWEEVYIHTDRDKYIAGEIIWFSARIIDRSSAKPSQLSRIVYFEVINNSNRPVVQKKIGIENGSGPGMALLPDTLSSGEYKLRAYTNWMKNFLPSNCYTQTITVFNAIDLIPVRRIADNRYLSRENDTEHNPAETEMDSLITITNRPDSLIILIRSDSDISSLRDNRCYLFVQTHGIIDINERINLTASATKVSVPKNSLASGINHITLFNSDGRPIFERYVLTRQDAGREIQVNATISSQPRSKSILEIETHDALPVSSSNVTFSVAITPEAYSNESPDIVNYLIFGSEFGMIPDSIRNKKIDETDPGSLDQFLKNVSSSWIDWDIILSGNFPDIRYLPENENHYLSGRLINRESLAPAGDKFVFISSPGKTTRFMYARTDKDGNFSFPIPVSRNINDIIIQPEEVDSVNTVNIESSFSEFYFPLFDSIISDNEVAPYVSKMSINYQLHSIYGVSSEAEDTVKQSEELPEKKNFYGNPDIKLIMDNYIKLPVLEEVFFELLPGVTMRRKISGYEVTIIDPVEKRKYNVPPGIFVDGVVFNNATILADLDPELVEQIDVVTDKYLVGKYLFYGIINVITKAGDFSNVGLPENAVRLSHRIIDPVKLFSSPDYSEQEIKQSRVPDLRNTLYWNPSVQPDDEGKIRIEFWTSDYGTDYKIDIQGIDTNGKSLSCTKIIKPE
jgi:hypothetical protein